MEESSQSWYSYGAHDANTQETGISHTHAHMHTHTHTYTQTHTHTYAHTHTTPTTSKHKHKRPGNAAYVMTSSTQKKPVKTKSRIVKIKSLYDCSTGTNCA